MAVTGATLRKDPTCTDTEEVAISSITVAIGDILCLAVGSTTWALATSASEAWQRKAVAVEAATTAATTLKVIPVNESQTWEIGTANASSATHNGDRMLLTDEDQVNNTGTDSAAEEAVVLQIATVGATTEQRALFKFLDCSGINPDAA